MFKLPFTLLITVTLCGSEFDHNTMTYFDILFIKKKDT